MLELVSAAWQPHWRHIPRNDAVSLVHACSLLHAQAQGQNTVSFFLQATHLALVFAGLCLRPLAWQILLLLQWSWAQGPAASAPHGRGLRW